MAVMPDMRVSEEHHLHRKMKFWSFFGCDVVGLSQVGQGCNSFRHVHSTDTKYLGCAFPSTDG